MHSPVVAAPLDQAPGKGILTLAREVGQALESGGSPYVVKEQIREAMKFALADSELVPASLLSPDFKAYRQSILHVDPKGRFSIAALIWLPGQRTPIHDHRCWCCFGVWKGRELETYYRRDEESGQLIECGKSICYRGDVEFLEPPGDIHQVSNDDIQPTVSIHVYGADLRESKTSILRCYERGTEEEAARMEDRTIAVAGGGFCGTMTAVHLLRNHGKGARIVLFEPAPELGKGAAYGTRCLSHLLNVPAGGMSAFPDRPQHFVEWCHGRGRQVAPEDFLPRAWYGEYLGDVLKAEAVRSEAVLEVRTECVRGVERDGDRFRIDGPNGEVAADVVVLAVGSPAGRQRLQSRDAAASWPEMIDPWKPGALDAVDDDDSILVVGTGLTFMDVVAELAARGHRGRITAISRRGLLPAPHQSGNGITFEAQAFRDRLSDIPMTARSLCRFFRQEISAAAKLGIDWREVVNAVRPLTAWIWAALSIPDRRRFARHLKPYWEVIRHRVAPATQEAARRFSAAGQLDFHQGGLTALEMEADGRYVAEWKTSRKGTGKGSFDRVINATGFSVRLADAECPLLTQLHRRGWLKEDGLGLGFDTASDFRLVDAESRVVQGVYYVGPMLRARFWECTAVPELRQRVAEVASYVRAEGLAGVPRF